MAAPTQFHIDHLGREPLTTATETTAYLKGLGIDPDDANAFETSAYWEASLDPNLDTCFAVHVLAREYPDDYLRRARNVIPLAMTHVHTILENCGRLGGCVDASMVLSRMLAGVGIFNAPIHGALRVDFPETAKMPPYRLPALRYNDSGRPVNGHAWLVVPPFHIIDVTVKYQEFRGNEADFLPPYLAAEELALPCDIHSDDLVDMNEFEDRFGIEATKQNLMAAETWFFKGLATFGHQTVSHNDVLLSFFSGRPLAYDGQLDQWGDVIACGKLPRDIVREFAEALG